jgi:MFS transporter, AAHS family, benzoate transport protein
VHLIYLAPEHVIAGEVMSTPGSAGRYHRHRHRRRACAQTSGAPRPRERRWGRGARRIVPATHFGRSEAILERAKALKADLIILNTEVGGQKAKAKLAQKIAAHHDQMAVLIARSTT